MLFERRSFLLKQMPKGSVCAEIGVWKGEFSREIVKRTRPRELHLIDPWLFAPSFPERWYGGVLAKNQTDMDEIHRAVCAKFKKATKIIIHRRKSTDAVTRFADEHFDWIYIDGDHSYEAVRQDLNDWLPKVRQGGFLTGDDYLWRDENGELSVKRAVDEFVSARALCASSFQNGQFIIKI